MKAERSALEDHAQAILSDPSDSAAVAQHERAIDEIVYRIYKVTDKEIATVEQAK